MPRIKILLDRVSNFWYTCGMNKILHDTVAAIASGTRLWVEGKATRSDYHPDSLMGWCAIAAAELHKRLIAAGIDSKIHMWDSGCGSCHCYCVVDDHVVDVTATQFPMFRNEPLVIMHCRLAGAYEMYRGTNVFADAQELRRFQKRECWPSRQLAYV